jgi:hypothetical protein
MTLVRRVLSLAQVSQVTQVRQVILVTLVLCLGLLRSAGAEVTVRAIDPPYPSSGQVVLILADAVSDNERAIAPTDLRILVEQDGTTSEAFVFPSATLPDAIYARLPDGLLSGPALLNLAVGADSVGDPFEFEVGDHAAAPALWAVYPYARAGEPADPVETVHAGDRLVLFGAGMDTTGVTGVLQHADGVEEIDPAFANTSVSVGVAPVFDLPPDLPAGPARLSARVRVCEPLEGCLIATSSSEGEAIELIVD